MSITLRAICGFNFMNDVVVGPVHLGYKGHRCLQSGGKSYLSRLVRQREVGVVAWTQLCPPRGLSHRIPSRQSRSAIGPTLSAGSSCTAAGQHLSATVNRCIPQ